MERTVELAAQQEMENRAVREGKRMRESARRVENSQAQRGDIARRREAP